MKGHLINFCKRIFYDYFLRDFSLASITFLLGNLFLIFGVCFGSYQWQKAVAEHYEASSGTVMLAALPIIIGTQFILSFINYDISKSRNLLGATFDIKE